MLKPLECLYSNRGKSVIVVTKGKKEYRGILDGYDSHMNLVLKQAEVYFDGELQETVPTVVVRGDNVIFISP